MLIEEYPALVDAALCREIIARFEADPRKGPSTVGNQGEASSIRTGTLLRVNDDMVDWVPLVQSVFPALQTALDRYAQKFHAVRTLIERESLVCRFPLVERVDPGQGFDWHYDQGAVAAERVVACLLYLNDVKSGGATEFKHQPVRIKPRAGKIALFPPYWTHLHRGVSPSSGAKYVMSFFWVYAAANQTMVRSEPPGLLSRLLRR